MRRSGAVGALACVANALLLFAPLAAWEGLAFAREPAVWAFVALASLFVLGDLPATTIALRDEGSMRTLALLTGLGVLASFEVSLLTRGAPSIAGAAVMLAGVWLRAWSVTTLGPAFTTELVASPRVAHGPYRFFRHPSELGLLLAVAGAALLLGSAAGLALAGLWVLPCSLARIRREDVFLGYAGGLALNHGEHGEHGG